MTVRDWRKDNTVLFSTFTISWVVHLVFLCLSVLSKLRCSSGRVDLIDRLMLLLRLHFLLSNSWCQFFGLFLFFWLRLNFRNNLLFGLNFWFRLDFSRLFLWLDFRWRNFNFFFRRLLDFWRRRVYLNLIPKAYFCLISLRLIFCLNFGRELSFRTFKFA